MRNHGIKTIYTLFLLFTIFGVCIGQEELTPWTIIQEPVPGGHFGWSIAAGDFNADSLLDIAIGAPFSDANGYRSGAVYVYIAPDFSTPEIIIPGLHSDDQLGISVDNAGDFNGDGYDDLMVGANVVNDIGAGYVFFGGLYFDSIPDIGFDGENFVDNFGYSCAGIGDIDHDGFDDIIFGALYNDALGSRTGKAYIYFGSAIPDSIVDIELIGLDMNDDFSVALDGRIDFDNDGVFDIVIGAVQAGDPFTKSGQAYVFTGDRIISGITTPEFKFSGEFPFNFFGGTVAGLGDINGDSFDDVIVGAYNYANPSEPADTGIGRAYVFLGKESTSSPWETPDLIITGRINRDYLGGTVGAVGDVNGDGFDDFAVSADWDSINEDFSGMVMIFTGGYELDTDMDYFCRPMPHDNGFGWDIQPLNDITGDGYPDFAISNGVYHDTGKVYIYEGFSTISPVSAELILPFSGAITSDSLQPVKFAIHSERIIDQSSIEIVVNEDTILYGGSEISYSDDTIIYTPEISFSNGETVRVCLVDIRTTAGDSLSDIVCTEFLVDLTAPVIILSVPDDNAIVNYRPKICAWLTIDSVGAAIDDHPIISIDGAYCPVNSADYYDFTIFWTVPESTEFADPGMQYRICISNICDIPDYGAPNCSEEFCVQMMLRRRWMTKFVACIDDKDSTIFFIGQEPVATDYFDPAIDIIMPPPPPSQADVRLSCEGLWLYRDIRSEIADTDRWIWTIKNLDTQTATINWNPNNFPAGILRWNDDFDMATTNSAEISSGDSANIMLDYKIPEILQIGIPSRWSLSGLTGYPAYNNISDVVELGAIGPFAYRRSSFYIPEKWQPGKGFFIFGMNNILLPIWTYSVVRQCEIIEGQWNLLSPPQDSVSIFSEPEGILIFSPFGFDGTSYFPADILRKGKGYWFFFADSGKVILE
ncbi:hypothetical protein DRQ33_01965 [bacterium]|nr:MAG: hypothetical protein DRQ33_01965 [bacterium]